MSRVVLFGGSFDPIHNGHIYIAKQALKALKADKVIFIISKSPRWKESKNNDHHRLKMLELALNDEENLEFSDIEFKLLGGGHYTIETIEQLLLNDQEKGAYNQYYFLLGEDQLEKLSDWYRIDELSTLVQLVSYNRDEDDFSSLAKENALKYNVLLIEGEIYECSSTEIRELKSIDVKDKVLRYIVDNHLYKYDEVYNLIDPKRYLHSVSVAFLARDVAINNSLNPYKAFIAGILHDIGKEIKNNFHYLTSEWKEYLDIPKKVAHQFIGASLARHQFKINDNDILNAIAYHCSGREKMSLLERLIYASDKMDPLRDYDSSEFIKACLEDVEQGFLVVLSANKEYLENKDVDFNNFLTDQCFKFYLNK